MVGDGLTVVVTDDEPAVRELFVRWLRDDHDVIPAEDGEAALAALSSDVDVVLLDREMPGPSGVEVAESIADSGHDPQVLLVSSQPADVDLDAVPVDDYLRKPVDGTALREAVERSRDRLAYERALSDFFALTAKLGAIEADRPREALADDERYRRLRWLVEEKRAAVDSALTDSPEDWATAVRSRKPKATAEVPCRRV